MNKDYAITQIKLLIKDSFYNEESLSKLFDAINFTNMVSIDEVRSMYLEAAERAFNNAVWANSL